MPIDCFVSCLTPSDFRLIARAKKRGPKAERRVIEAIARRAGGTARLKEARIKQELLDEVDRCWPPPMMLRAPK
jgi:hypothetical protein